MTTLKNEYNINLREKYISILDDPRITIDVALDYKKSLETYNDEWSKCFFDLMIEDQKIIFPIKDSDHLSMRCEEILNLFNVNFDYQYSYYCTLFSALLKVTLFEMRDRVNYTSEFWGKYGNPELMMAKNTIESITSQSGALSFFENTVNLDKNELTYNTGYETALIKLQCFLRGVIWTQSNCGVETHRSSRKIALDHQKELSDLQIKTLLEKNKKEII